MSKSTLSILIITLLPLSACRTGDKRGEENLLEPKVTIDSELDEVCYMPRINLPGRPEFEVRDSSR